MSILTTGTRRVASGVLAPLLRRAAQAYVAGEHLSDALDTLERLKERGIAATLGYWDGPTDSPRGVADHYLNAVLALSGQDAYLSIKPPALKFSTELANEVARSAAAAGVRLHCDSHGVEVADESNSFTETIAQAGATISFTLPGRWRRSLDDAQWAIDRQLPVRVVKGQWSDPADPTRDMRAGYLEVIDRLAGKAARVEVATHDVPLALDAITRLTAAGTPVTWELLHGLPMRAALRLATERGIAVRIYVPYGAAYLPYALGKLRNQPRIAWWLLRDLLARN
jgi:proline dehydrogenase